MKFAASTPAFDRALSVEIAASEQIRMRVLAGTLAILFLGAVFARETLEQFAGRLLPTWLPLKVFGPFLAYEILALVVLRYRRGRGKSMPTAARFANAVIETSLPTVILWWMNQFTSPLVAFGAWPTLLYFVFIVASTLRLDFVLPAFTGAVAAISYLGMACWVLSFGAVVANPISLVEAIWASVAVYRRRQRAKNA
jgi:adenylate cyclase